MRKIKTHILLILIFLVAIPCLTFGQGSTYTGGYTTAAPILYNAIHDQIIDGLQITNPTGICIRLENCTNVTIRNCKLGPSKNVAIYLYKCTNITITNCSIESSASGLLGEQSTGIKFNYNDVKNVLGPFPRGQMVQISDCYGGGNQINFNACENIAGQSNPEDAINISTSNGLPNDPIQVANNWIRGGGPSTTGGGLLAGDGGGSYQLFENNICVNTGNEGIEVAGGHDMIVRNNKFYSQQTAISNIGISVWKQSADSAYNMTVENNQVYWAYHNGGLNNLFNAGNCGVIKGWSTNLSTPSLSTSILPAVIIGRARAVTTDIATTPTNSEIKMYPNPASDHITVESARELTNSLITIYNIKGQQLIVKTMQGGTMDIDTHQLSTGVYILKISSDNQLLEEKKLIIGNK